MILIIVESPTKARTIEKYVSKFIPDAKVMGSAGHIRDLPKKQLGFSTDDFKPNYEIIKDKIDLVNKLREMCKKADKILLATDADREGEAIAWHLQRTLKLSEKTKRMVFNEITPKALKEAYENLRDIDLNLVKAQEGRRLLDRLIGFTISPIMWNKVENNTSAGRVQSVVLAEVIRRQIEISEHMNTINEKSRLNIQMEFKELNSISNGPDNIPADNIEEYIKIVGSDSNKWYIKTINNYESEESPPKPYTTSVLQQDGNSKLRLSTDVLMKAAQKLYQLGHISYHRTDSTELSADFKNNAVKYIEDKFGKDYAKWRNTKSKKKGAQEAHEAIRPTKVEVDSLSDGDISPKEKALYRMIWVRAVGSQMAPAKYSNSDLEITAHEHEDDPRFLFKNNTKINIFKGYLILSEKEPVEDITNKMKALNTSTKESIKVKVNDGLIAVKLTVKKLFKEPPQYFKEGTMVKHLEKIGVGRPSTYAAMISTNIKKHYITINDFNGVPVENITYELTIHSKKIKIKESKQFLGKQKDALMYTELGEKCFKFLNNYFMFLINIGYTSTIEDNLDKVANAKLKWKEMLKDIYVTQLEPALKQAQTAGDVPTNVIELSPGITIQKGKFGWYIKYPGGKSFSFPKDTTYEKLMDNYKLILQCFDEGIPTLPGTDYELNSGKYGYYWNSIKTGKRYRNPCDIKDFNDLIKFLDSDFNTDLVNKLLDGNAVRILSNGIKILKGQYGYYYNKDGKNCSLKKYNKLTNDKFLKVSDEELLKNL